MNEQALKTVVAFNNMPKTEETESIKKQYLADEINYYEFFCLVDAYMDKNKS